jgi:NADH dehydrogenase/putative oxidoreductase
LVVRFDYQPSDNQLFGVALFGWYCVQGAGPISMDHLLRRGLAESALPLAPRVVRLSAWIRLRLSPLYLSVVRIWIACTLLRIAAPESRVLLPLSTSAHLGTSSLALMGGGLLLLGLATRQLTLVLALTTFGGAMMNPQLTDGTYLLMIFGLLSLQGAGYLSLDALLGAWWKRSFPNSAGNAGFSLEGLPRVLIVGAPDSAG